MRTKLLLTLLLLAGAGWTLAADPPASDAELENKLVGTWEEKLTLDNGAVLEGRMILIKGGRMTQIGSLKAAGRVLPLIMSGTWKVKDGYLHFKIESSNISQFLPNGFAAADKILRVTSSEFVYVDSYSQKTMIAKRVK